jgi:hypothetical protein
MTATRALFIGAVVAHLSGCGADIEPYDPTLAGIDNEGIDADGPPKDVSFVDGKFIEKAKAKDCGAPAVTETFYIVIDNQYRNRTVRVERVAEDCSLQDIDTVAPGQHKRLVAYSDMVIRIVDAEDDSVISTWRVTGLNSLTDDRLVLRSTDPDI